MFVLLNGGSYLNLVVFRRNSWEEVEWLFLMRNVVLVIIGVAFVSGFIGK